MPDHDRSATSSWPAPGRPARWRRACWRGAGARVTLIDRSRFPRPKLCGDTLNPGAVALLGRHVDVTPLQARATPIAGMLLSGPGPVLVRGEYDDGVSGLGVTRDVLDAWLVEQAVSGRRHARGRDHGDRRPTSRADGARHAACRCGS